MKKQVLLSAAIILVFSFTSLTHAATYGGGSGTAGDPWLISTPEQMNTIGTDPNDWAGSFKLTANIDMTGLTYNIIGNNTTKFTGTFDGENYVISNLTYTNTGSVNYVGLFGYTDTTAVIQDLGVENAALDAAAAVCGALAGHNSGTISSCYATGSVSSSTDLGGLVGRNTGTLSFCNAAVTVNGTGGAGGLVCYNPGNINNCYATGAVTGNSFVGGLVAFHDGWQLENCYATGTVTGTGDVGGLVGYLYMSITNCFWDTETSGTMDGVGNENPDPSGAAGKTTDEMQTLSTFTDAGWDFASDDGDRADWWMPNADYPRLFWQSFSGSGTEADPYSIWTPQQMNAIGANTSYWNKCFKLMTDIDMSTYTDTEYNIIGNITTPFTGDFDGNGHIIRNLTYTTTEAQNYIGLFGFLTGSVHDLGLENVNISSAGDSIGGLAGLAAGTTTACYATGTVSGYSFVGGLVGYKSSSSPITACYATGTVSATDTAGGLIGYIELGTITACYATGTVSGYTAGGLAGRNLSGTLSACYATGDVTGINSAGGLAGYNGNVITGCYSTGAVSGSSAVGGLLGRNYRTIIACCWDTQTSGTTDGVGNENPDSSGVTGKTTAEMQSILTFIDSGWDFVTSDGDPADWEMPAMSYPRLTWEVYCGDAEHPYPPGDTNYDCQVDLSDFAIVAAHWLECTALDCN